VKSKCKWKILSEWQVISVHRLILKGIEDEYAGIYRNENLIISGAQHIPPDAIQVNSQMERFIINWYENEGQQLHPIEG
jgi:hypothetical protein